MGLIVRNDEQIKVGITPGLTTGSSFFIFDGTNDKPDYRQTEIVPSELNGRGILEKGLDYSWLPNTGRFDLLLPGDQFAYLQGYNIHFQPIAQPLSYDHNSLINSSFFIRAINIPATSHSATLERLNRFIAQYEEQCLIKILGRKLYNTLLTEDSQRITDLIYGTEYYSAINCERYWDGLVHGDHISLIANYVYYWYQDANAKQTTTNGTKNPTPESAEATSPKQKMINAWAFFASETRAMCSFLWNQQLNGQRIYPEFTSENYLYTMKLARKGGVNNFGF